MHEFSASRTRKNKFLLASPAYSLRLIQLRVCAVCAHARPLPRHTCASQVREYLAPPRLRRPHGRYVVTMKGVAFEDQKLLALPSALSYDWLLPGVENGGPWRAATPSNPFSRPVYSAPRPRRTCGLSSSGSSSRVSSFQKVSRGKKLAVHTLAAVLSSSLLRSRI